MNIANIQSYTQVEKFWAGGRIISAYPLGKDNICFFYLGSQGDPVVSNTFREKPLIVEDECLNYVFTDKELNDIYEKIKNIRGYNNTPYDSEIEKSCRKLFKHIFDPNWNVKFDRIEEDSCKYATEKIALHPILHLVDFTHSDDFSRGYYKEMLRFLLKKHFLVNWIDPKDISQDMQSGILSWCTNFSENEIKSIYDLRTSLGKIVNELFNKFQIFGISYLAAQCGNQNSAFKVLLENLHSVLPEKEKEYVEQGYYFFQPKMIVTSIEIHFIQMITSKYKLNNFYRDLKKTFDEVKYYNVIEHKTLSDEIDTFIARRHHEPTNRHRFLCKIELAPPVDYSDLSDKIYEIGSAIKTILTRNKLNNIIREMWIKKIELQIFTPPQFEDDIIYSLAQNWLISRDASNDFIDGDSKMKITHVGLACDYLVFKAGKFLFSFDYSREIQYAYTILNKRLSLKHNFTQFSIFAPNGKMC